VLYARTRWNLIAADRVSLFMTLRSEPAARLSAGGSEVDHRVDDARTWLEQAVRLGSSREEALEQFDRLPPAPLDSMPGLWRGTGLHTGHPIDGLLEAYGWYGKAFDATGDAHPLLFRHRGGIVAINPRWIPTSMLDSNRLTRSAVARAGFAAALPMLRTEEPKARLRMVAYRGVETAAMIYDRLPIIDLFRRVAPDILLGLMDLRGEPPFFFTLHRVERPQR
jgi:hypothetical protein